MIMHLHMYMWTQQIYTGTYTLCLGVSARTLGSETQKPQPLEDLYSTTFFKCVEHEIK